jgi:hypothetical protein
MKSITFLSSLLFLLLFTSCKEEIIVVSDQKETAVIYGVLDPSESIQYIKITKAINGTANALEEAKNESANYFDNVEATVFEVFNGKKTNVSWVLKDTVISDRAEGLYYGPKQKVYFFRTDTKKPLRAESSVFYHLEVKLNNKYTVTAVTDIVSEVSLKTPNNNYQFAKENVSVNGYDQTSLNIFSGNATVINTQMDILIQETNADNSSKIETLAWKISETSVPSGKNINISINGEDFYKKIKNDLTNELDVTQRKLVGIDLTVSFGSSTLEKYISLNKPSSSLAQTKPNFTNITTKDDIRVNGIFTSRNKKYFSKRFIPKTQQTPKSLVIDNFSSKELCIGPITNNLKFCTQDDYYYDRQFYCGNN